MQVKLLNSFNEMKIEKINMLLQEELKKLFFIKFKIPFDFIF